MTGSSPAVHKTIVGVQYARGIAALLVVFYHVAAQMKIDPAYGRMPSEILEFGYVGVPIFFVISGFIITIVSLDAAARPRVTLASFFEKRAVRILPFMWVAIIAYNLLSFVGTNKVEWGAFLRAMTLWPTGTVKPNVIWTLRHEAIFYALFALCFLGHRRRVWPIFLWCLIPVIIFPFQNIFGASESNYSLFRIFFSDVNIMFGAGLLIGLFTLANSERMRPSWPGGSCAIYAAASAVMWLSWLLGWRHGFGAFAGVTVLAALLIIGAIRIGASNSVFDRAAILLGDASYAIYLVHNMLIVPALIAGRHIVSAIGIWPIYLVIAVAAIMLGIAAHLFVEKPLIGAISKRLPRRARPAVGHASI